MRPLPLISHLPRDRAFARLRWALFPNFTYPLGGRGDAAYRCRPPSTQSVPTHQCSRASTDYTDVLTISPTSPKAFPKAAGRVCEADTLDAHVRNKNRAARASGPCTVSLRWRRIPNRGSLVLYNARALPLTRAPLLSIPHETRLCWRPGKKGADSDKRGPSVSLLLLRRTSTENGAENEE